MNKRAEHKKELESMIKCYGFKNTESYIGWLDLASSIKNIELTKELIAEIRN